MLLLQILWNLYTNSTTELKKMRLIIPASDWQSPHFSPLNLRFEQTFILAGAREIPFCLCLRFCLGVAEQWFTGKVPSKPTGVPSSSFFPPIEVIFGLLWDAQMESAVDTEALFLAMGQGGYLQGLSQSFSLQEVSVLQTKKGRFFPIPEKLFCYLFVPPKHGKTPDQLLSAPGKLPWFSWA